MICLDLTSQESFDNIENHYKEITQCAHVKNIIALVGTKKDHPERIIGKEAGQNLAEKLGMGYFETDAESGDGVNEAFENLTKAYINMT